MAIHWGIILKALSTVVTLTIWIWIFRMKWTTPTDKWLVIVGVACVYLQGILLGSSL